jgi:hypothetical protein
MRRRASSWTARKQRCAWTLQLGVNGGGKRYFSEEIAKQAGGIDKNQVLNRRAIGYDDHLRPLESAGHGKILL